MPNTLYYGDNLRVLREHVPGESVDQIYLDPPLARNAASTFSAVTGNSVIRTPTASNTALAMAPATGMLLLSPTPLLS